MNQGISLGILLTTLKPGYIVINHILWLGSLRLREDKLSIELTRAVRLETNPSLTGFTSSLAYSNAACAVTGLEMQNESNRTDQPWPQQLVHWHWGYSLAGASEGQATLDQIVE